MSKPLPIIDLAARYRVIIETDSGPRWRTIGQGVDSAARARECARELGYTGVWIFDGLGGKRYVVTQ